jgi:hypothetical protein
MKGQDMHGNFADFAGERWYRIDDYDHNLPFFMALVSDSDVWAFISSAGSLAAGRTDQQRAFFPYETVDKIHRRAAAIGPRTWIRVKTADGWKLWMPFAEQPGQTTGRRSLWKNRLGNRIMFQERHPQLDLWFSHEWSASQELGLVRTVRLGGAAGQELQVLDGLLGLLPSGVSNQTYHEFSNLTEGYAWNEAHAGRLGLFSLYAQIWDRAEPKESFEALSAWHTATADSRLLISDRQVDDFIATGTVAAEELTRGRRGAFLVNFGLTTGQEPALWHQVVDGPLSQVGAADLLAELKAGRHDAASIAASLDAAAAGLAGLLAGSDGFQDSGDEMAATHHLANVIFNTMRGGALPGGDLLDLADLAAFAKKRNPKTAAVLAAALEPLGKSAPRAAVVEAAAKTGDAQALRLATEYLPLTFSRRHGDPSRPWNRFAIRVRDAKGQRIRDWQGNWRDIFQNWEALAASQPEFLPAMITTFLGAMTPDGHNPYRVTRDGIDWETVEHDNPWSFIGYWGDHQVIYLLKFLEQAEAMCPGWLAGQWDQALFSYAAVPYRIRNHAAMSANPKATIDFDEAAHHMATERCRSLGADGRLVLDSRDRPVLACLGEKLLTILLAKAGALVPGGGIWMNTQRPEWNDANNALVGYGLSMVSLAALRRFLAFLDSAPWAGAPFAAAPETVAALVDLTALAQATPRSAATDPAARRAWFDQAGAVMDRWRGNIYGEILYQPWRNRPTSRVPADGLKALVKALLPLVDATLEAGRRDDGLFHSYNLLGFGAKGPAGGVLEVSHLYPMLEGQVAVLGSGFLKPAQAADLVDALYKSPLYRADQDSFVLYPDRRLKGFLERNVLDAAALASGEVKELLAAGRRDILETQADGTVRFAPKLANRYDVELAFKDQPALGKALGDTYERLLNHREFTGRSGTMFAFEGLGCIYWHMVAKLLLAVQEQTFAAADSGDPALARLAAQYRRVRAGLGYKKSAALYGSFPFDPYSHTPGEAGAQQPGMTGQVKEEVLTRWGELGLRWHAGKLSIQPVLFDAAEFKPDGSGFGFSYQRIPFRYKPGQATRLRVKRGGAWKEEAAAGFELAGAEAVELELKI